MNNGAFGENFPYSNFHDLNMDWIIKIAKDFLDQYTHIQEIITSGEESLQNLTTDGLEQLQVKADALEASLQQWYDTHSADIANVLAQAIIDFRTTANNYTQEVIASIPQDYSELALTVQEIENNINQVSENFYADGYAFNMIDPDTAHDGGYYNDQGTVVPYLNYVYYDKFPIDEATNYTLLALRGNATYEFYSVYAAVFDDTGTVIEYINGTPIQNRTFPGASSIAISLYGTIATTRAIFMQSVSNIYIRDTVEVPYKRSPTNKIDLSHNTTDRSSWFKNSKLFNNDTVLSINRIGNIGGAPENSIAGFKNAFNAGFNIILADLLWTIDGVPVCCHDNDISRVARTSTGETVSGVRISATSYTDLLNYDFGIVKGQQYKGTKILPFRELLNFVKLTGLRLWIEFKNFDSPNYSIRDTVELTYEYGIADRIVWCGGVAAIRTVHNAYPDVALAFMASEGEIPAETFNQVMGYKENNDLFIFGWTNTTLTQAQKNQMIANGSKFACGTIDSRSDIITYILENPFCCGIESNTIVASNALIGNFFPY